MAARHLIDRAIAAVALVVLAPVLAAAALGIRLSSRGPIFYPATRAGLGGHPFTMYKFRTMHIDQGPARSRISARRDPRVFRLGSLLRTLKVDELPQLLNVVRGDMAIVGPRPEDPSIVEHHYTTAQRETLAVLPGLASPGSIYNYTHGERDIRADDPEADYLARVLPVKLALDTVYVREASFLYDLKIIVRTLTVIVGAMLGKSAFSAPPELLRARRLLDKSAG